MKIRSLLVKGFVFGIGFLAAFGVFFIIQAVTPGSITNPAFGPLDDDVDLSGSAVSINGNQITGLPAGREYVVGVYGWTADRCCGYQTFNGVRLEDCSGTVLAQTDPIYLNVPDGSAPQSATFVVTIPASGCLKGFTDYGQAVHMTAWST